MEGCGGLVLALTNNVSEVCKSGLYIQIGRITRSSLTLSEPDNYYVKVMTVPMREKQSIKMSMPG